MTHDLVERLRKPWDGSPGSRKRRDEERAEAADKLEAYMAEIAALRAEKDEIRKALEPFSKYETADGLPCGLLRTPDRHPVLFNGLGDEIKIVATVGDFRLAAAAIRNMGERT